MTVEYCATYCAGYQYFGVEYSQECYCGNAVDPRTQLEACGKCSSVCVGNPGETCGGPGHLSLYKNINATQPQFVAPSACSAAPSVTSSVAATGTGSGSGSAPTTTGISCPSANGTTYSSAGQQYVVECGVDRQGGDLYALQQNSFGACLDYCSTYPGCVDISYVGNNCYLKNVIMAPSSNPAVSGARLVSGAVSPNTVFATNGQQYNYLGVVNEPSLNNQGTQKALITSTTTDNMMTLEECATFCTQTSSTFFGVENQNTCYCGNSFSTGSTQSIGTPQNPILTCLGNVQEQCGGNQELTTYALPGTPSPFDNTGKLVGASGSSSSSSASSSSSTSSSTSSSVTAGPGGPVLTTTASVGSACNTMSGTVCNNLATCTLSGTNKVCSLTTTSTASASATCAPAQGTVCSSQVAVCMTSGNAASCSVTSTITAAASASCAPVEGTACSSNAACTGAANGGSTCQVTSTTAAVTTYPVGFQCGFPGQACQSFATCKDAGMGASTCAYQTTTQSSSGSAAICMPTPSSTVATVCGAGQACAAYTGTTSTCGPATGAVNTATMNGQCAPNATPATVCQSTQSCSSVAGAQTSLCVKPTITAASIGGACQPSDSATATVCPASQTCSSVFGTTSACAPTVQPTMTASLGNQCAPSGTPATVCGSTASCASVSGATTSTCGPTAQPTITASMGNQCAPSGSPATVCGATASCSSVSGAQTSVCATPTITALGSGVGARCQPSGSPTATVCAGSNVCNSVSGTTSTCGAPPTTTASLNSQCAPSASPTATVCGASTTCYPGTSGTSTCGFPSSTVGINSVCGSTVMNTVQACNTATATCQPNFGPSTCAYITATQTSVGGACTAGGAGVQPTTCASGVATCNASKTCARVTSAATGFGDSCNVSPGPTAAATTCPGTGGSCQSVSPGSSTCAQSTITATLSARCDTATTGLAAATVCQGPTATCQSVSGTSSSCAYTTSTATLGAACNTAAAMQTQCEGYATCTVGKCARITSTQSAIGGQCTTSASGPVASAPCATSMSCASAASGTSTCRPTSTPASSTYNTCNPNFDASTCNTVAQGGNNYGMWYGPANNGTYQQTASNADLLQITGASSVCAAAQQCATFATGTIPDDPSFGMVYVPCYGLLNSLGGYFYCGRFTTPTGPPFAQTSSAYSYSWGWST